MKYIIHLSLIYLSFILRCRVVLCRVVSLGQLTVLGVLLISTSCISDGLLFCKLISQDAYFTSVHLIFLGSDITFLGLHRYIMSSSAATDNRVVAKSNMD